MRRSVLSDVSISELLSMRDSGMSNQEIADSLGCSYYTVLRLIGKQPKEMRKEYTRIADTPSEKPKPAQVFKEEEEFIPASLVLAERTVVLQGEVGRYEIDTYKSSVSISITDHGQISIPMSDLKVLYKEIAAIIRNEEKTKFTVEAW